jgi:DNA-directed RNA polymerase specialized sigma24 family protein
MFSEDFEDSIVDSILLHSAVASLDDRHRAAVGLSMAGFGQAEIATILGIGRTSARSIYCDALQILQEKLSQEEEYACLPG